jgi:hypothetical protein
MLGFCGHFVTKSRGYSTRLGELRAAYRAGQDQPAGDTDDESMAVLSVWQYLGAGAPQPRRRPPGGGVGASLRAAREALLNLRRGPP